MANSPRRITVGWREWGSLPELNISTIKLKVDTGAKTSALHAFDLEPFQKKQQKYIRFKVHPNQKNKKLTIQCEAPLIDQRQISDSGGHKEMRYVIQTMLTLGKDQWPIEITLTNRSNMRFRMLLGRRAMVNHILVDPTASFLCGKLEE